MWSRFKWQWSHARHPSFLLCEILWESIWCSYLTNYSLAFTWWKMTGWLWSFFDAWIGQWSMGTVPARHRVLPWPGWSWQEPLAIFKEAQRTASTLSHCWTTRNPCLLLHGPCFVCIHFCFRGPSSHAWRWNHCCKVTTLDYGQGKYFEILLSSTLFLLTTVRLQW